MEFKEYKENYNYAPYTLEKFAQGAENIEDNDKLREAAKKFLRAKTLLELTLENVGIELG